MCALFIFLRNFFKYNFFYLCNKFFAEYEDVYTIIEKRYEYSKQIKRGSNIIIYGFGPYGVAAFEELFSLCRIRGVFDIKFKDFKDRNNLHKCFVEDPQNINSVKFDYVVISVMNEKARKSVEDYLLGLKIEREKFIYINYKDLEIKLL